MHTDDIIPGAETIDLRAERVRTDEPRRAVLLLHGFGDTPQTLRYLAESLHQRGYTVRVPLLPGHGRTVTAFDATPAEDWIEAARAELIALRARNDWVALCGISMGGAIAALLAAEVRDLPALVLLAPYLRMPLGLRCLAATHELWSDRLGPVRASSPRSIRDPEARARTLAYGVVTGHALHQLLRLSTRARAALPRVTSPTLIVQSAEDNRVAPRVARMALRELGAARKRLLFTRGAGHIITVDYGRDQVAEEVCAWLGAGPGTESPQPDARHGQ